MKNICVFSNFLANPIHIIAHSLSYGPYSVTVATNIDYYRPNFDHENTLHFLSKDARLKLISIGELDDRKFDVVVFLWSDFYPYLPAELVLLRKLLHGCEKSGAVFHTVYTRPRSIAKRQLQCLVKHPWLFQQIQVILQEEVPMRTDLFSLVAKKVFFGAGPHPQFMSSPMLEEALAKPFDVETVRPWKLNFLGSRNPPERVAILEQVERLASELNLSLISSAKSARAKTVGDILWIADAPASDRPRDPIEYLEWVENSSFTLSPRGCTRWTNRPYEAIMRGSVPILDDEEAKSFRLDFRDGDNCILVRGGNWGDAVRRALNTSEPELVRLRESIMAMRQTHLGAHRLSKRFRSDLGIE